MKLDLESNKTVVLIDYEEPPARTHKIGIVIQDDGQESVVKLTRFEARHLLSELGKMLGVHV